MLLFRKKQDLIPHLSTLRSAGRSSGFIPTMGALHAGHISLLQAARSKCGYSVTSIFVNPTQFNDPEDLAKYPRPIEKDIDLLEQNGCDVLYLPDPEDIYGNEPLVRAHFALGALATRLEGASRPGHFDGVAQVVKILLGIVQPDLMFLGQKDYQQVLILRKLIAQLSLPVAVYMCPIVREPDGLAMSSRNGRLSPSLRKSAPVIFRALQCAVREYRKIPEKEILQQAREMIEAEKDFHVDYFQLLDAETLGPPTDDAGNAIAITAVLAGNVRLLDNMLIPAPK